MNFSVCVLLLSVQDTRLAIPIRCTKSQAIASIYCRLSLTLVRSYGRYLLSRAGPSLVVKSWTFIGHQELDLHWSSRAGPSLVVKSWTFIGRQELDLHWSSLVDSILFLLLFLVCYVIIINNNLVANSHASSHQVKCSGNLAVILPISPTISPTTTEENTAPPTLEDICHLHCRTIHPIPA